MRIAHLRFSFLEDRAGLLDDGSLYLMMARVLLASAPCIVQGKDGITNWRYSRYREEHREEPACCVFVAL